MLKTFTKGEKKLLKDLKTKYFHFIMIKSMSTKRELKEEKKEKEKQETKRTKAARKTRKAR